MVRDLTTTKQVKVVHPKAKVSFANNFLPPIAGLLVTLFVFGALNSQWIAAEWQYKHSKPIASALVIPKTDDGTKIPIGPAKLTIGKINVSAPIIVDQPSTNEAKVQIALRSGVVHYGNTAIPGQNGNIVIVGHSSGQLWAPGDYKFVFTLLNKITEGDLIQIDYNGTRYTYKVTGTKTVTPQDLTVLAASPTPTLTLITCTPVGSSTKRFVVSAEQISPSPASNKINQNTNKQYNGAALPGNTPSLWTQIKDSF